jgi:hypothetical protein
MFHSSIRFHMSVRCKALKLSMEVLGQFLTSVLAWRWRKGQSGNRRGRPRRSEDCDLGATVIDLIAKVHHLQRRLRPQRDSCFERFRVLYELAGNAYRSALHAGYSRKAARSKAYLLGRRATEAARMG